MALHCIKATTPKHDTNATQHGPYMSVVTTTEITLNAHQSKMSVHNITNNALNLSFCHHLIDSRIERRAS